MQRCLALLQITNDVLDHDDRIVDHEAGGDDQRHQRQIVDRVVQLVHHRQGADQRHRHGNARNDGRRHIAQEHENHQHHEHDGEAQLERGVRHRGADHVGAVGDDFHVHARGQRGLELRQLLFDLIDGGDHIGAGLTLHIENDGLSLVVPGALLGILRGLADAGDIAQVHRRPVLIGNDRIEVILRILDLVVAIDGVIEFWAVDVALRLADVDVRDQRSQVVDVESVSGQLLRIGLDPDRRHIAARGRHQTHSRHFGNLRPEPIVGDILQLRQRHRIGRDRQCEDGLIGRIDLRVGRRRR